MAAVLLLEPLLCRMEEQLQNAAGAGSDKHQQMSKARFCFCSSVARLPVAAT